MTSPRRRSLANCAGPHEGSRAATNGVMMMVFLVLALLAFAAAAIWLTLPRSRNMQIWTSVPAPCLVRSAAVGEMVRSMCISALRITMSLSGKVDTETARASGAVVREYPPLALRHRDSDGRSPQHSFSIPRRSMTHRYWSGYLACAGDGHGEVEVHLHHDDDTADNLRHTLTRFQVVVA